MTKTEKNLQSADALPGVISKSEILCLTPQFIVKCHDEIVNRWNLHGKLLAALERLLACPDLNLEEMEDETVSACEFAMSIRSTAKASAV